MKKIFLLSFLTLITVTFSFAQNVGINTTNPGSTLSVNGSLSAGYNNVTTNYLLTVDDYFVVYNGTSNATFYLPAALAPGSGNFKGRVYKIKNNSSYQLTIDPAGNEKINTDNVVVVPRETTLELINTGLTSGSTWEAVSGLLPDGIRKILESGGCISCPAYDLANVNTWVQITSGEYSLLQTGLNGMASYGATAATMAMAATNGYGGGNTVTQNFSTMSQMPAGYYSVALSVKTGSVAPANMSGMNLKLSNTGQSSGYVTIASVFSGVAAPAAQTIYYFLVKRPSVQSPIGAASNMAIYQSATYQLGAVASPFGTNLFIGSGDISNPSNSSTTTSLFQVMATTVKVW